MIRIESFLPVLIMVESFLAAIVLLFFRKYGSALYWFSAALLNFAVIFCIKKFG